MFRKILSKLQVKASAHQTDQSSRQSQTARIPYLDLDEDDREDDGFLLIGDTATERSTCNSVENSLDLPPSYDSVQVSSRE